MNKLKEFLRKNEINLNDIYKIPNLFTLSRIPLSIAAGVYILVTGIVFNNFLAIIYGLAGATDFADGYTARKFNMSTKLGKILDPIADSIMTWSTAIPMLCLNAIPVWSLLIAARTAVVWPITANYFKKTEVMMAPTYPAKIKTGLIIISIVSVMLHLPMNIAEIAMAAAVGTIPLEALEIYRHYFKDKNPLEKKEITEAMTIDGANQEEIEQELKLAKNSRRQMAYQENQVAYKERQLKVDNFANNMIDEIMLNVNLSTQKRAILLNVYKKMALTMGPFYESPNVVEIEKDNNKVKKIGSKK